MAGEMQHLAAEDWLKLAKALLKDGTEEQNEPREELLEREIQNMIISLKEEDEKRRFRLEAVLFVLEGL